MVRAGGLVAWLYILPQFFSHQARSLPATEPNQSRESNSRTHTLQHEHCTSADIAGHNWTYIAPEAFSGGDWSAEHRCVYNFQSVLPPGAASGPDEVELQFLKPPGCLTDSWAVARGNISLATGTVSLVFEFYDPSGSLERTEAKVGRLTCARPPGVSTGAGAAGHAFLDMQDRGMYVRGYGHGRDHPMDFADHEWIRVATAWVVRSAIIVFPDGTRHITPGIPVAPGALPHYDGQYLRDGYYGISHGWSLVNASMQQSFRDSVSWMFSHARDDGIFPLSCHVNGRCYIAENCDGSVHPTDTGCQDLDSAPFATLTAYHIWENSCASISERNAWYDQWGQLLDKSLNATTKLPGTTAVWSNTSRPMVGYGFQDNEVKSGVVLFSNVLYWNATLGLAEMAAQRGDHSTWQRLVDNAAALRAYVSKQLWNEQTGVFMASTVLEARNVDLWANAAAATCGFATATQSARIFTYFRTHADEIFYDGQVRQIPFPTQWSDTSTAVYADPKSTVRTYQVFALPLLLLQRHLVPVLTRA